MLHTDLQALADRLDRIARAIDLGCTSLDAAHRAGVAEPLVETCWEDIRLGTELLRHLAYDDLWAHLPLLHGCWQRIEADLGRVCLHALDAADAREEAHEVVACLDRLVAADEVVAIVQHAALAVGGDVVARGRLLEAVTDMEHAADRFFIGSLPAGDDRLDAALALLTAVAARGARLRRLLGGTAG